MNRSTFFKTTLAAVAAFFGFKKVEANPWKSKLDPSIKDGQWVKMYPDGRMHVRYSSESGQNWGNPYDLPFDGNIRDFKKGKDAIDSFIS